MPLRRHKLTKPASIALAVVVLACLWLAGLYGFTRSILNDIAHAERDTIQSVRVDGAPTPPVTDAIVVLTGGANRLETGFDLLEQKRGKKLFISGVYRGVEVRELLAQWRNEDHSALDCCVVLGFEADNTVGNARETAAWMAAEGYRSLYLVTAHYHMKRALLDFRRAAPDLEIIPYPVSPDGLDMNNWWRDGRYRSLIIREYLKYLAKIVIYAIPEGMLT